MLTTNSLCAGWHPSSSLILCIVMIRGKQRGLLVALDHAQPDPIGDVVQSAEGHFEEVEAMERERRQSHANVMNAEAEGETA